MTNPQPAPQGAAGQREAPDAAAPRASGTRADTAADAAAGTDTQSRYRMIAEAAYFRAERRGFAAGGELQDWLDAEEQLGCTATQ